MISLFVIRSILYNNKNTFHSIESQFPETFRDLSVSKME